MTAEPPPVYLEGHGAILPDGTHIPADHIKAAVDLVARLCDLLAALPPETRVVLEAEAVARGGGE